VYVGTLQLSCVDADASTVSDGIQYGILKFLKYGI
jgi:hypothetical protein